MRRFPVEVPASVSTGAIGTNFVQTGTQGGDDPILMLHGFDSSLLEFRRLIPKLGELGADAYAVDVLGWGFTDLAGVTSFGAGARFVFHDPVMSTLRESSMFDYRFVVVMYGLHGKLNTPLSLFAALNRFMTASLHLFPVVPLQSLLHERVSLLNGVRKTLRDELAAPRREHVTLL